MSTIALVSELSKRLITEGDVVDQLESFCEWSLKATKGFSKLGRVFDLEKHWGITMYTWTNALFKYN